MRFSVKWEPDQKLVLIRDSEKDEHLLSVGIRSAPRSSTDPKPYTTCTDKLPEQIFEMGLRCCKDNETVVKDWVRGWRDRLHRNNGVKGEQDTAYFITPTDFHDCKLDALGCLPR